MKLTDKQKHSIWKSLNLNEDFFDDNNVEQETDIEETEYKHPSEYEYLLSISPILSWQKDKITPTVLVGILSNITKKHSKYFFNHSLWFYNKKYKEYWFGTDGLDKKYPHKELCNIFDELLSEIQKHFYLFVYMAGSQDTLYAKKFIEDDIHTCEYDELENIVSVFIPYDESEDIDYSSNCGPLS